MIFELAQDFHDAVAAMPEGHARRRMLGLLEEAGANAECGMQSGQWT